MVVSTYNLTLHFGFCLMEKIWILRINQVIHVYGRKAT
jgi:hypothetical protein